MLRRFILYSLIGLLVLCLAGVFVYYLPPVHDRLAWRVNNWRVQIKRALTPSEQVVFLPQEQQDQLEAIVRSTLLALEPTSTSTVVTMSTSTPNQPGSTPTLAPSPTLTMTPTPIPDNVLLSGLRYEPQTFNNCGPANLSMALSYWNWQGNQKDTRAYLRPNHASVDDKNVSPVEMVDFVESNTQLEALTRVAGDIDLLKRLIAAGFPVIIEKGHHPNDDWWMGHYLVLTAYDDSGQRFITQDSLLGADLSLSYAELGPWWRNFNYLYIVIYPPERESEVLGILGPQADPLYNYQYAAQIARDEIADLSGRDLYFAWYNLGTNLVALGDYTGAAGAYDQAFLINATLPEKDRLHRMLWYQDGPYQAYFQTERYTDVIELGNATLAWVGEPVLEETFYWMGLAREAQGDLEKAIYDLNRVVEINPNNTQAVERLQALREGVPGS